MSVPAPKSWLFKKSGSIHKGSIPIADRGFRYGMSVFESLRIRDGKIQFQREHWLLLENALQISGFPKLPPAVSAAVEKALAQLEGDWFARIYVTAGDGGPADSVRRPRFFVFAEPRERQPLPPHHLLLHPEPQCPVFLGIKTGNYWFNTAALRRATGLKATEALLFNPSSKLTSACMANVFLKIRGSWVTPTLKNGARQGIVREWVLRNFDASEKQISLEEVCSAKSIFLTNSWSGITAANRLGKRILESPSEVAQLREKFEALPF